MIELCRFDNINGTSVELNDLIAPLTEFSTSVDERFTERNKSQQHGIYPSSTYWGKRLFHFTGSLQTQDSASYIAKRMAMVGAFMPRPQFGIKKAGTLTMLFTGMSENLTADCSIDGYPDLPMQALSPSRTSYLVNLKSPDPRMYGDWHTTTLQYGILDNIGGRGYDKTYNKTYSSVGTGSSGAIIGNSGNVESFPNIKIYGPVTDPRITLQRSDGTNLYFTLTGLILADITDTAVISFADRTVTRWDGSNLYRYAVGGDWFSLEPSYTNVLYFTGSAGAAPAKADISWRNAYMI